MAVLKFLKGGVRSPRSGDTQRVEWCPLNLHYKSIGFNLSPHSYKSDQT